MKLWMSFGFVVYWIFWIGSMALGASGRDGLFIGVTAYFIWLVILQIMWFKEFGKWIWK